MKKLIALLLALTMVLALAACGGGSASDPVAELAGTDAAAGAGDTPAASSVGKTKVSVAVDPAASLTPWGTANSTPGAYEVYEMLYECDAEGHMYPLLADGTYMGDFEYGGEILPGIDHEEGSAVYDVHIYDCIYDHNGNHVTADDVAFSYNWQKDNEAVSGWGEFVSIEALNETTVRFTFTQEQLTIGGLIDVFCRCYIVNQKSYEDSGDNLVNKMCGTGPYKFVSYQSNSELVIEAYPDYWQLKAGLTPRPEQAQNVDIIDMLMISESAQKVIGLRTGALNCVYSIDTNDAKTFEGKAGYQIVTYASNFVFNATFNCDPASVCSDVNMRLAIANAIDIDNLILMMGGNETRLYAYACDYYSDYSYVDWASMDNYNTKTGVDAALVQSYLDAAGYNGETVTIITATMSSAAEIIVGQLMAVGINAEMKTLDMATATTVASDPTQWSINLGQMAGSFLPVVWAHGFETSNVDTGDSDDVRTANFVRDPEWQSMLETCNTINGHTSENMQAWWQHCVDNAYAMGLYTGTTYMIMPENMTKVVMGDKQSFLAGACEYDW